MSAPRLPLLLVAFLLVAGLGLAWLLARGQTLPPRSRPDGDLVPTEAHAQKTGTRVPSGSTPGLLASTHPRMNIAEFSISRGRPLRPLLDILLVCAESGDADCQYSVYRILDECTELFDAFADESAVESRIAAIERRPRPQQRYMSYLRQSWDMCEGVDDAVPDASERFGWLRRSFDQGHPLAQLRSVEYMAQAMAWRTWVPEAQAANVRSGPWAGMVSLVGAELADSLGITPENSTVRLREILVASVMSGHPDALHHLGDDLTARGPEEPGGAYHVHAWRIAACDLGRDCAADARWWQIYNSNDDAPLTTDARTALASRIPEAGRDATLQLAARIVAAVQDGKMEELVPKNPFEKPRG